MTKRELLEILLRVLGVYLLVGALSGGLMTAYEYYNWRDVRDEQWAITVFASVLGFFYMPLFLALGLTFGAKLFATILVGARLNAPLTGLLNPREALLILLKVLGIYFIITSGSNMVATLYEMASYRLGMPDQSWGPDMIYSVISTGAGCWLAFKTETLPLGLATPISPDPEA